MKRVLKVISVFLMVLVLTGCMKVECDVNILDQDNAEMNMSILYAEEMMKSYGIDEDQLIEQFKNEDSFKGWTVKKVIKTIENEKYIGVNAKAPKESAKEILNYLTVKDNKYTLKLKTSQLDSTNQVSELEAAGYSIEKLESAGIDFDITITMPGKVKSASNGKISGNKVTLGLKDMINVSDEVKIVSEENSSSNTTLFVVGGLVVAFLVAGGYFLMKKKKATVSEEQTPNIDEK